MPDQFRITREPAQPHQGPWTFHIIDEPALSAHLDQVRAHVREQLRRERGLDESGPRAGE